MICLRCGYCCTSYLVVIVDDPEKGIQLDNLISHLGGGPCKHLLGKKEGEYSCSIHDFPWYKETPCCDFSQIETSPDCECRIGRRIMDKKRIDTAIGSGTPC